MAQMKSPRREQILQEHVKKLVESRPNNRSAIYPTLTQIAITAIQKGDGHEVIYSQALPTTFKDVMSGNEAQTLDALGFLGGLLQFMKLKTETQVTTVELLSQKLKTVTSKGQSRKLMWSLANIQFDEQLPRESLCSMMNSALLYLSEKPPIPSLSTMCEALNTLKNMGLRSSKFLEENLAEILSAVFPCLFSEADRIRQLALECLEPYTATIQKEKLLNASYQAKLKNTYYSSLMKLVSMEAPDSLKIWGFLISAFGTEMQSVALLNGLLKIEETALKSKNTEFRQMALEHWTFIIDCFALTPSILNNSKRIHLILVPLKSTECRTEEFSVTKIHLWWHLLNQLGTNAAVRYQEVTSLLLNFCFGVDSSSRGNVQAYPNTNTLSASVLASVLSPLPQFVIGPLSRSFPFLNAETFSKTISEFTRYCCAACSGMESEQRNIFDVIFQAFIERCTKENQHLEQLKAFIDLISKIASDKVGFFESLLASLTKAIPESPTIYEATLSNIMIFFQWAGKNEPLPTHPFYPFLKTFCRAGLDFAPSKFSSSLMSVLEAIQTDELDVTFLAELWKQFAVILLSLNPPVIGAEEKVLTTPLKWIQEPLDDDFHDKWYQLFAQLKTSNPGTVEAIVNSFSPNNNVATDDRLIRFLIRAWSHDASHNLSDISTWFTKWITSLIALGSANKDGRENVEFLSDLILFINEFPSNSAEPLLHELKASLESNKSHSEVSNLLKAVFDSPTPSKSKAVQKVRASRKICKIFNGTPTKSRSSSRSNRGQSKFNEDFVVIPPTPKSKRILTERQKEVMRSKKLNSSLPAMYSDLSQDSLLSENASQDTQSQITMPTSTVESTLVAEEEALLEPPSPMNTTTITAIAELSLPLRQKSENVNGSSIEELLKKDLKLKSKVTVDVVKLVPTALLRNIRDRPAPASVKAARSKTRSSSVVNCTSPASDSVINSRPLKPVDLNESSSKVNRITASVVTEPQDKENAEAPTVAEIVEAKTLTSIIQAESPVPTTDNSNCASQSTVEKDELMVDQTEKSNVCENVCPVEEMEIGEETPGTATDNSTTVVAESMDVACHPEASDSVQSVSQPTICITDEDDQTNEIANAQPSPDQKEMKSDDPLNTAPIISSVSSQSVSNSLDLFADSSQQQEVGQKPAAPATAALQPKKFLKDHCTKAKASLLNKNRGHSPNTGKRGAHILELSRKISNEPPSKKPKMVSLSPSGMYDKRSVGDASVTASAEGSPAREKEPWVRHTYSPYASPSGGILKKRPHADESDSVENSPTSLTKSRRVSFAFPEVSDSVDIPKVRTTRTRRSLLGTYKPGHNEPDTQGAIAEVPKSANDQNEQPTPTVLTSSPAISSDPGEQTPSQESPSVIDSKLAIFVTSALTSDFADAPAVEGRGTQIDGIPSSDDITDDQHSNPEIVETSENKENENQVPESKEDLVTQPSQNSEEIPDSFRETNDACGESASLESQSSPSEGLDSQNPIFPDLIGCSDSVATIIDQLVSVSWRPGMYELLSKQNIHTIGELCCLTAVEVQRLPLDPLRTVGVLTKYKNEKSAEPSTDAVLTDHTHADNVLPETCKEVEEVPQVELPVIEQETSDTKEIEADVVPDKLVNADSIDSEQEKGCLQREDSVSVGNDSEVQEPMETETCSSIQGTTTSDCSTEPEADKEIQDPVQANGSDKDLGENDFETRFLKLPVEEILALISRHPERNAIYVSCNKQIILHAFPSLSNEK